MPNNDYANEPNQSRSEEIIQSILDNTEYDEEARSRIEYLLIELKNAIEGGGGGGGVTSYSPLTEKPKIDNHTLQAGNNTSSDLGLQTKIDADHKLSADNVDDTNSTNKFNVKSDWNAASGAAGEILNKPALGTASAKNVPASGDAATGEVVLGSDTRLTDARNAKDVYNWAKQENKPSYSYSEIQNTPTIPDELADLTEDSTHRTVTDTEKSAWSGKQNALTFDNAPTSNSDNPVKSGGVYTALSGKQNNLSEAQMAAANSGATADKINKIAVNENNISLLEEMNGAKNYVPLNFVGTSANYTISYTNRKLIINGSNTSASSIYSTAYLPIGEYWLSGCPSNGSMETYVCELRDNSGTGLNITDSGSGVAFTITTAGYYRYNVRLGANYTASNLTISPMIITKAAKDAGFTDYQPYALSNAELTNNILTYAIPTCTDTAFTTSTTGAYVYTGISFTVPSGEVWEFFVADKYNGSGTTNFSNGLLVSDSSSAITNVSVIAENTQVPSVSGISYWVRQLTGITPKRTNATTYYVWTNRAVTTSCNIFVCLRRVF